MKTAREPQPSPSVRDADKLPYVPCRGERAEARGDPTRCAPNTAAASWPASLEEEEEGIS